MIKRMISALLAVAGLIACTTQSVARSTTRKTVAEADQRAFIAANDVEQRRLPVTRYAVIDPASIDPAIFGGAPIQIERLE